MIRKILAASIVGLIGTFLLIPKNLWAQSDSLKTEVSHDSTSVKKKGNNHSLFAGIGLGNNLVYMGATISQDRPYEFAGLTYGYKSSVYLAASAVHLTGITPFAAFYTGSISFNHTFNSWFDISTGISRYQVPKSLTDTLFNSFTYGELNLGFDWKILYTKLSVGGLYSTESIPYFQIKNSRYFDTQEFGNKKLNFSFDPYANLLFTSLTKTETLEGYVIATSPRFRKHGQDGQTTSGTTKYSTFFGLMEIDFGLPIAFNAPRLTIEAEPSYILPFYDDPVYPVAKGFVLLFSIYYKIF